MIKLQGSLPNTIKVEGREFLVKTDFKYWLMVDEILQTRQVRLADLFFIFEGEKPTGDPEAILKAIQDFITNPNSTPHGKKQSERVMDYQQDGEYIYASFLQAYGIDLLETNMHWHKFKALVLGLPKSTIMAEIESIRGYKKDNRKFDKIQQELKEAWRLPDKHEKEKAEEMEKRLIELFGE